MRNRSSTDESLPADAAADSGRAFDWRAYATGICIGAFAVLIVGLIVDGVLIRYGVAVSSWRDALYSSLFSIIFAAPGILAVWRIGVVTLRQYILSALILFAPLTVLSLIALAIVDDIVLTIPWLDRNGVSAMDLAYTAYLRIARSAVLTPCFLIGFYLTYHKWFCCAPRVR